MNDTISHLHAKGFSVHSDSVANAIGIDRSAVRAGSGPLSGNRLCRFVGELRRRHVCRVATIYVITLWLMAQVIDVLAEGLSLPEWAMKAVVIFGLSGFPFALILSWLFDITPDGRAQRLRGPEASSHGPTELICDFCLLVAALMIGACLAFSAFQPAAASSQTPETIAVEPFRAASGDGALAFSVGLATELQHELVMKSGARVISIDSVNSRQDWRRVSGTVAIDKTHIRATVSLIDGASGTVVWSQVFERESTGNLADQQALAEDILRGFPAELGAVFHE